MLNSTTTTEYDEPLANHSPDVLAKLQKLLRLGQQSDSQGEVQAAMGRAQALATKHRIDLAKIKVVDVDPVTKEPFTERAFKYGTKVYNPMEIKYIAWLLQEYFGVAVIYQKKYDHERAQQGNKHVQSLYLKILGRHSDTEFATYAYEYLREVFPKLWRREKDRAALGMDARRSFYVGVYNGIAVALREAKQKTEAAELATLEGAEKEKVSAEYQLMIVGEKEELDAELKNRHPVLGVKKQRPGNIWNTRARNAGFQAGLNVKINRPLNGHSKSALK